MQWLKSEKIKHRLIGLAVLISIGMIFIPAMVKKSNQQLDRKMQLTLNLPPKPNFPKVEAVKPTVLLNTVKVAHVVIPSVSEPKLDIEIARAESLSGHNKNIVSESLLQKAPVLAKNLEDENKISGNRPSKPTHKVNLSSQLKKNLFAVQLASFTNQYNAQTLVQKLNKQGFNATYDKQGNQYRVLVGQLDELGKAQNLKIQLVNETKLQGFIVKAG